MIGVSITTILFIASLALEPRSAQFAYSELKRRARRSKYQSTRPHELEEQRRRMAALIAVFQLVLLLTACIMALYWLGYGIGITYSAIIALVYGLGRSSVASWRVSQQLYGLVEPYIYKSSLWIARITPWLGHRPPALELGSKDDLLELIKLSPQALSDDEQIRLKRSLSYAARSAKDVMVAWDQVATVKKSELLGPLRLDELHKTGRSTFPVVSNDSVVGLLDISNLVTLKDKRSLTAGQAMTELASVRQDDTLDAVLRQYVATKQTILIVQGAGRKPVGIIQLADVLQAVTGQDYAEQQGPDRV